MRYNMPTRFLSVILCVLLMAALFAGCNSEQKNTGPGQKDNAPAQSAQPSQTPPKPAEPTKASSTEPEPITLPIVNKPLTLSMFASMDSKVAATLKNYNEMLVYQELEKRTGIHIDFILPPIGNENEQFNLMLASQDLPDMIHWGWMNVPGGPEKAIMDGTIIELNDGVAKYAPNITKIFKVEPPVKKDIMTDGSKIYMFPFMRLEKTQRLTNGFQIRKDWLDKLGLKAPTNLNEWYTVLTAFKQKDPNKNGKADELPFISNKIGGVSQFMTAWGMNYGFYVESGKIKFGPTEPAYKEYLETMQKWFKEGLIDPDYITTDGKGFDSKVTSNLAGSYYGLLNGNMGRYTGLMKDKDPEFLLWEVPFPITSDGKSYCFAADSARAVPSGGLALTSRNKNIKESVKWADYFYSEEGIMLTNFGIEGKTYTMVNGQPKFTDLILKNPEGLSLDVAISKYAPASAGPRFYQDPRYWDQIMMYPNQREAMKILAPASSERFLPPITPTPEESARLSKIVNEINTYKDEMFNRFIMGMEPLENYNKYIDALNTMGLKEAITIQQTALGRYEKRGQ